jgi:hypothetical protein
MIRVISENLDITRPEIGKGELRTVVTGFTDIAILA